MESKQTSQTEEKDGSFEISTRSHQFCYNEQNQLSCEKVDLRDVVSVYGTPTYVYSADTMTNNYLRLAKSLQELDFQICFANKANSNIAVLRHFSKLGCAFEFASAGEL
jgi:diaminopimelate decarboxylase